MPCDTSQATEPGLPTGPRQATGAGRSLDRPGACDGHASVERARPAHRSAGRRAGRSAAHSERGDLYAEITARIIAELEAGRVPWVQPWSSKAAAGGGAGGRGRGGIAPGLPCNAATRRPYSGINILILWGEVIARGYPTQGWLTFRQALAAGGSVRKGERGTTVVYADRFTPRSESERATRDGDDPRSVAFLKRFTVFNVAQCDGLAAACTAAAAPLPPREIVPTAEALIVATGADVRIGGDKAFYVPSADFIQLPPQPAFFDQINYYRTAFHELSHWTGHSSRLARDLVHRFASDGYAREELVAEMSAAFVCASLGIVPTVRHADYIGSWLSVLRDDSRAIVRAASAASRAADFLLGHQVAGPQNGSERATVIGPEAANMSGRAGEAGPGAPCEAGSAVA